MLCWCTYYLSINSPPLGGALSPQGSPPLGGALSPQGLKRCINKLTLWFTFFNLSYLLCCVLSYFWLMVVFIVTFYCNRLGVYFVAFFLLFHSFAGSRWGIFILDNVSFFLWIQKRKFRLDFCFFCLINRKRFNL